MTADHPTRTERDSLGPVEVPVDALWGVHTQRAITAFAVSGLRTADRPDLVVALAQVKIAAARANTACGVLDADLGRRLEAAAAEIVDGHHHDQFPIDLVQGGGGTATNLNANEVIANLASRTAGEPLGSHRPLHPIDHVNRSQSTNDVYPTALAVAVRSAGARAVTGLGALAGSLRRAGERQGDLERLGRTCVQDAVPLTVRDTHRAQAHAIERTAGALADALDRLLGVPLGATAIGTGIGAPDGYAERAVAELAALTGDRWVPSENRFDALAHLDEYVAVAAAAVQAAIVIGKLASDVRFWSSGPRGGIGELRLPAVMVGSSIMPGKVNPVIPELAIQVAYDVRAAASAVELAAAGGELELNVMEPVVTRHLLGALDELAAIGPRFADSCVDGWSWDAGAVARNLVGSVAPLVDAAGVVGYDAAARAANAAGAP
ncbi:MAG: lyase family protein [Ilumatobacteraceae bacterium]